MHHQLVNDARMGRKIIQNLHDEKDEEREAGEEEKEKGNEEKERISNLLTIQGSEERRIPSLEEKAKKRGKERGEGKMAKGKAAGPEERSARDKRKGGKEKESQEKESE